MSIEPTITLHYIQNDGKRERTKLTHHTIAEARKVAKAVPHAAHGLYTEVDLVRDHGTHPLREVRRSMSEIAVTRDLNGSYIPPRRIRDLRDLTRARATLAQESSRLASRIQKVLEDANIKLGSVVSETLGKSGAAMFEAIIAGQNDPVQLANLARGLLRAKIPQLRLALEGIVREHHRFLLDRLLTQWRFVEHEIELLDDRLEQIGRLDPELSEAVERWDTAPGVDRVAGWGLVAEIGVEMAPFPSASHLASWGGMFPGNHESAGKHFGGKTRKGNPWLRRILGQSAWAAARTKNTYLSAQFRRLAAKRSRKRAIVVGHSLLVIGYHLQKNRCIYQDLGADYFDRIDAEGLKRYLVKRLEAL